MKNQVEKRGSGRSRPSYWITAHQSRRDPATGARGQKVSSSTRRRSEEERRAARAALAAESRITDDAVFDQFVALEIHPDTLAALRLVPRVEVAWIDGVVEQAEKHAILSATKAAGLEDTSAGPKLLEARLSERPHAWLTKTWRRYVTSICTTLSAEERNALEPAVMRQSRAVAEVTGGFLGFGSRVSSREEALLAEIAAAFNGSAEQHRNAWPFWLTLRMPEPSHRIEKETK